MNVTFLVEYAVSHEGGGTISSHRTFEQGIEEIEILTKSGSAQSWDGLYIRAVAPGCGPGIVVAEYHSSHKEGGPLHGPIHPDIARFNREHSRSPIEGSDDDREAAERRLAALGECYYRDWWRVL